MSQLHAGRESGVGIAVEVAVGTGGNVAVAVGSGVVAKVEVGEGTAVIAGVGVMRPHPTMNKTENKNKIASCFTRNAPFFINSIPKVYQSRHKKLLSHIFYF